MDRRKKVVYIGGKYSGNIDENIGAARSMAIRVWNLGFTALTPHLNTSHFEVDCKCDYNDYINGDLELLSRCDCLLLLDGWHESEGAVIEFEFAKSQAMPIFFNLQDLADYLGW